MAKFSCGLLPLWLQHRIGPPQKKTTVLNSFTKVEHLAKFGYKLKNENKNLKTSFIKNLATISRSKKNLKNFLKFWSNIMAID